MNILILSVGTRNKIVQYFKEALGDKGTVIATDCSLIAPALYEADKYYIVPRITADNYLEVIFDICKKEQISGVLSLIDPELSLLAENSERFTELGVTVIGSSYRICERALDKWKMYQWLVEHGYNCAKTYSDIHQFKDAHERGEINFPVFVKPRLGSASIAISKVNNQEELEILMKYQENLIIQEFLDGQEIGVDCYIDLLGKDLVSVFAKKKLVMRAGETDKAISYKDKELFELIEKFVLEAGYLGQIDIDIFMIDKQYYISEVNPRFGGGYPHAYECGVDHMRLIVNNLKGIKNSKQIGTYEEGIYMMKYNEIKTMRKG